MTKAVGSCSGHRNNHAEVPDTQHQGDTTNPLQLQLQRSPTPAKHHPSPLPTGMHTCSAAPFKACSASALPLLLIPTCLQDQQVHWADALQQLQVSNTSSSDAAGAPLSPQQLSQQLQGLYEQLLALPDPLPALRDAAALTAKTQGGVRLLCGCYLAAAGTQISEDTCKAATKMHTAHGCQLGAGRGAPSIFKPLPREEE